MRRQELSDEERAIIALLLLNNGRAVECVDDRRMINGILWRFRTVSSWRDCVGAYGPRTMLYNRFSRWRKAGVWDRLLGAVSRRYDGDIVMIGSSCIRVQQHRANAKKRKCWANIPAKTNRKPTFSFSRWVYRQRNLVEGFFNRIKQMRGLATRYDRRADSYLVALKLAATSIWIASANESGP